MALTGTRQFITQWDGNGTPDDPNLVSADELIAFAVPSSIASTATSTVTSQVASGGLGSVPISTADSKAVSSGLRASIGDSKALSVSTPTSVADSKALSVSLNTSIADSKAVSVGSYATALLVPTVGGIPGFLQAGTGAVARTANGKMGEILSVRDFAAVGNGVADDTAAIQAALDACQAIGGGTVFIPPGTYLTGQLNMPGDNITIKGAGSGYVYGSSGAVFTKLKAKPGTTTVLNLVVTGLLIDRAGCLVEDLEIDGNLNASYGIKSASNNVMNRVWCRGCLVSGILLANGTNATRISTCGFVDNFGWGLQSEGSSTTTFSVENTNLSLNQTGGVDLEAGVVVNFKHCVVESNSGYGVRIYRPDAHTGAFGSIAFEDCWLEDNGVSAPNFTLLIDSQTRNSTSAPWRIRFDRCRFSARKVATIMCAKWVTFEDCNFAIDDHADTLTLGAEARYVAWIECEKGFDGSLTITDAMYDAAIAAGTNCYRSARGIKHSVGDAGKPAFQNGWGNVGAGYAIARYWFDPTGYVHLEGMIQSGTPGTTAFTLPTGYRPATHKRFATSANGVLGMWEVLTSGQCSALTGGNVDYLINGISFPTD